MSTETAQLKGHYENTQARTKKKNQIDSLAATRFFSQNLSLCIFEI